MTFFEAHSWHPYLVLLGLAFVPRITMFFMMGPFSPLMWVGWGLVPHFTVAFLATQHYWNTNPVLCCVAWFCAFAGTGGETKVVVKTSDGK